MLENKQLLNQIGEESVLFAQRADNMFEKNLLEDAITICEAGVKRYPLYAEGHFMLGKCYDKLGRIDEAKNEYERALFFVPSHTKALRAMADIYYKNELSQAGDTYLLKAALHDPLNQQLNNELSDKNLHQFLYSVADKAVDEPEAVEEEPAIIGEEEPVLEPEAPVLADEIEKEELATEESTIEVNEQIVEPAVEGIAEETPVEVAESEVETTPDSEDIPAPKEHEHQESLPIDEPEIVMYDEEEVITKEELLEDDDLPQPVAKSTDIADEDKYTRVDSTVEFEQALGDVFGPEESKVLAGQQQATDSAKEESTVVREESDSDSPVINDEQDNIEKELFLDENDGMVPPPDLATSASLALDAEGKPIDLSKYANVDDDFSTLMDDMFHPVSDNDSEEDWPEDQVDGDDLTGKQDHELIAEERPFLDTAVIFQEKKQSDSPQEAKAETPEDTQSAEEIQTQEAAPAEVADDIIEPESLESPKVEIFSEESDKSEPESEIEPEVISADEVPLEPVDIADNEIILGAEEEQKVVTTSEVEESDQPQVEELAEKPAEEIPVEQPEPEPLVPPAVEPETIREQLDGQAGDEAVNIEDIMSNPSLLTPTFGEILIAQKKFSDARHVFVELSKKEPENPRFKKKIDFLNKLVALNT